MNNPIPSKKNFLRTKVAKAFSLVELLVVIAVIGIIAAVAIPNIGNITAQATTAKTQRNAQSIASTFSAARAAGNTTAYADAAAAVTAICTTPGITGTGNFATSTFYVPLSATEQTAATTLLTLSATDGTGQLIYAP